MTSIITTIGPASEDEKTLQFFYNHSVTIARLNFSHNVAQWHISTGEKARKVGMELMIDLAGPKVLLGELKEPIQIRDDETVYFEKESERTYPHELEDGIILPCAFNIADFAAPGDILLIDDGKIEMLVESIFDGLVRTKVIFGGLFKSHKGMNFPGKTIDIDFLVDRDLEMIRDVLVPLKPEYIAPSFVRTAKDLDRLNEYVNELLSAAKVTDYYPKICIKLEVAEVMEDKNLREVIEASHLIMIARGDLALETEPIHISVPFYQEKIKRFCLEMNKPFVVATQILETMMDAPVPTRAEVSDLYRAVVLDKADYVMLSGEAAAGKFPIKCVSLMHNMITKHQELEKSILGEVI